MLKSHHTISQDKGLRPLCNSTVPKPAVQPDAAANAPWICCIW